MIYWFEFGGNKIGRMSLDITQQLPPKQDSDCSSPQQQQPLMNPNTFQWKLIGKYKNNFPAHFTLVYVSDEVGFYILGGNGDLNTCLCYDYKTIKVKSPLP